MVRVNLSFQICTGRICDAIEKANLSEPDKKRFSEGWKELEGHGAEMVEIKVYGDRIVAFPSDDFTRFCEGFGIYT